MPDTQQDKINKAKNILNKHGDDMKQKYSAHSVAAGYRIEKGKMTDKIALLFYVEKKKNKDELSSEGIMFIPEEIDGIETQVIEVPGGFRARVQ